MKSMGNNIQNFNKETKGRQSPLKHNITKHANNYVETNSSNPPKRTNTKRQPFSRNNATERNMQHHKNTATDRGHKTVNRTGNN
jgi:hypothetical protein